MNVALIHYNLKRGGGMESYLADLVRGFRAAGDTVDVWARDVDADWARTLGANAYRLLPLPLPRRWRNRVFASRIARLELTDRYPLVISLARTRGQHIAINGGAHPGFCAAMQRPDSAHDRIETRLERAMLASSATVVAHSRTLALQIGHYYPEAGAKTRVIYPPVDGQRFAPRDDRARAVARQALGLAPSDIAFVFPSMDHDRSRGWRRCSTPLRSSTNRVPGCWLPAARPASCCRRAWRRSATSTTCRRCMPPPTGPCCRRATSRSDW